VGQAAVGEANRFESDYTHVKQTPKATIAAWLWKYYEYGLPDTPGRIATGLIDHLTAQGFEIVDRDEEGPPVCTCEFKPCECEEEWFNKQQGVTNDGSGKGDQ
jgi:hypothetical protein